MIMIMIIIIIIIKTVIMIIMIIIMIIGSVQTPREQIGNTADSRRRRTEHWLPVLDQPESWQNRSHIRSGQDRRPHLNTSNLTAARPQRRRQHPGRKEQQPESKQRGCR